jgi:hypothetical protein
LFISAVLVDRAELIAEVVMIASEGRPSLCRSAAHFCSLQLAAGG